MKAKLIAALGTNSERSFVQRLQGIPEAEVNKALACYADFFERQAAKIRGFIAESVL